MHNYLRSVGFYNIIKEELDNVLYEAVKTPDSHEVALDSEGNEYVELRLSVAKNMGIAVRGSYDSDDIFHMDYYFPYFVSEEVSTESEVEIIKQSDRESYQGLCDEVRLGVNLIFHLQNMMEFLQYSQGHYQSVHRVCLAGLSDSGKILLPIYKSADYVKNLSAKNQDRNTLVAAAREGDEDAIENLTLEDMDTYSMISKRVVKEDILSIVTTYFMPYGIESDKYSVLGEILNYRKCINQITMETVYIMTIESNDMTFDVCINSRDLLGEPAVGRRFKGNIWMQGNILMQ